MENSFGLVLPGGSRLVMTECIRLLGKVTPSWTVHNRGAGSLKLLSVYALLLSRLAG